MNDRFKFRAVDESTKTIYWNDAFELDIYTSDGIEFHFNAYLMDGDEYVQLTLLQCTGLKDKNGVLIYEGDIVGFTDKVEWYSGIYSPRILFGKMTLKDALEEGSNKPIEVRAVKLPGDYEWLLSSEVLRFWEIIGNIYENPELLENNNE